MSDSTKTVNAAHRCEAIGAVIDLKLPKAYDAVARTVYSGICGPCGYAVTETVFTI